MVGKVFKLEEGPTDKAKEPDPGGSDQQNLGFKKLKSLHTSLADHQPALILGFNRMKRLGVFLLPRG